MNALEDTRELVTTQDGLSTAAATDRRQLARTIASLVDDLIYKWPDVEIASIRITEQPFIGPTSNARFREFTVTGRRGPLTASAALPTIEDMAADLAANPHCAPCHYQHEGDQPCPDHDGNCPRCTPSVGLGALTAEAVRGPLVTAECPSCHTTDGHPHTDYCNLTKPLTGNIQVRDPDAPGQWLHYEGNPSRTDHRAAGGTWHPIAICTRIYCGATPEDGVWPGQDSPHLDVTVHSRPVQVPLDDPAVVDDIFSESPDSP